MDLLVPCIEEGRSELRNAGRVNCKTHWPFSGCRAPYLLNDFRHLQVTAPFGALQCAWLSVHFPFVKSKIIIIFDIYYTFNTNQFLNALICF